MFRNKTRFGIVALTLVALLMTSIADAKLGDRRRARIAKRRGETGGKQSLTTPTGWTPSQVSAPGATPLLGQPILAISPEIVEVVESTLESVKTEEITLEDRLAFIRAERILLERQEVVVLEDAARSREYLMDAQDLATERAIERLEALMEKRNIRDQEEIMILRSHSQMLNRLLNPVVPLREE